MELLIKEKQSTDLLESEKQEKEEELFNSGNT